MADDAIRYMKDLDAATPDKPFLVYYVPGATHSPHHPTKEWIDKISAMKLFDQGWEKLREQIFANQKRLGVIPANTQLTPWPDSLPKWDSLSAVQKKIVTRQADVFAAYTAYNDHEIGRVIQAVQDMGKLDNTLIIYINGDNGTSSEGSMMGTPNTMTVYNGVLELPELEYLRYYESWGSDATYPHMAVPWAWAFDTPFKWVKQVASHFGGTRQGMAISWPGHIDDVGGIRTQFHHVIDIVPTILEAAGIRAPDMVDGIKQKPIEGVSMAYTFKKANANAPSKRTGAVLRDLRQPRHLQGRLVRGDDAARAALARRHEGAAAGDGLQVGALQHRRGLLAGQRPGGEDARQTEGDAGGVRRRGEQEPGLPARQLGAAAPADAAPERRGRSHDLHLPRRQRRHPGGQCAGAAQSRLHDQCRDHACPRKAPRG
jgi:arylsulfatase A-like enzyme